MYQAKTSFLLLRASPFGIEYQSQSHVLLKARLGPHFSHFMLVVFEQMNWGTSSKFSGAEMAPQINQVAPNAAKKGSDALTF